MRSISLLWPCILLLALLKDDFVEAMAKRIEVLQKGPVYVYRRGSGSISVNIAIPQGALDDEKQLLLCHKKHWWWFSKCDAVPISSTTQSVEMDGNALRDSRYYFALRSGKPKAKWNPFAHMRGKSMKSQTFKILGLDTIHEGPPFLIKQVVFKEKVSTKQLFAKIDVRHTMGFEERIRIKLFDAETGKKLSSVYATITNTATVFLDFSHEEGRIYYAEIWAYTGALKEAFRRMQLVYRAASSLQGREISPSSTDMQIVEVQLNTGSTFSSSHVDLNALAEPAKDRYDVTPFHEHQDVMWQNVYDRSDRSVGGTQIPEDLRSLFHDEDISGQLITVALNMWLSEQPNAIKRDIVIIPNGLLHNNDDKLYVKWRAEYMSHRRFHVLPIRRSRRGPKPWIVIIYDKVRRAYLVLDSTTTGDKFIYWNEIAVFAYILSTLKDMKDVPRPNVKVRYSNTPRALAASFDYSQSDPAWKHVHLWLGLAGQQKGTNDEGAWAMLNTMHLIHNNLVGRTIDIDGKIRAPEVEPNTIGLFRRNLFVHIAANCANRDTNMIFPSCIANLVARGALSSS